jgi:phage terminase small subunit
MTSKTDGIKLTFKQKEWLKLYLETGNATQSALQVYDTDGPNTASVIGSENLTKLRIPVLALMEKRGLTLGRLLEVLDDGLQANKVLSAKVIVQGDHKEATTQTEVGKEKVRAKNKKWLESPRGRVFRKNDKARRRGAEGSFTSDYWQWLIGRTQGYCFGCGKRFDIVEIEPDHILPISRGGKNVDWNIQPLCQSCNRHKSKQLMFMDNYIIDMLYAEYLLCRR